MDPHWLFADPDPDPQNLMNADPDQGQENHQIDFKSSFKSWKNKNLFKSVHEPSRSATF